MSEEIVAAFKKLSVNGTLNPDEMRFVLRGLPEGGGKRFAKPCRAYRRQRSKKGARRPRIFWQRSLPTRLMPTPYSGWDMNVLLHF